MSSDVCTFLTYSIFIGYLFTVCQQQPTLKSSGHSPRSAPAFTVICHNLIATSNFRIAAWIVWSWCPPLTTSVSTSAAIICNPAVQRLSLFGQSCFASHGACNVVPHVEPRRHRFSKSFPPSASSTASKSSRWAHQKRKSLSWLFTLPVRTLVNNIFDRTESETPPIFLNNLHVCSALLLSISTWPAWIFRGSEVSLPFLKFALDS